VIPWSAVFDRGGWALAGVAFMLVFFGLLVPRSLVRDRDDALSKERARNDNLADSIKSLLAYAEIADKRLQTLNQRWMKDGNDDDDVGRS
jgi:hypothetical protein